MQIAENSAKNICNVGWTSETSVATAAPELHLNLHCSIPNISSPKPAGLFICRGLMSEEDLNTLGFSPEAKVVPAPEKDEGSE